MRALATQAGIVSRGSLRLIFVAIFFAVLFFNLGANAYFLFSSSLYDSNAGFWVEQGTNRVRISDAHRASPAGEVLRESDELLAVNDQPYQIGTRIFLLLGKNIPPDTSYTVRVRRATASDGGEVLEFTLRTVAVPIFTSIFLVSILIRFFVSLAFLLTGLALFLLRPDDKQAVLLALILGSLLSWSAQAPDALLPPWFFVAQFFLMFAVIFFQTTFVLHFFLVFPERSPLLRRFPRIEWGIYVAAFLAGFPYVAIAAYMQLTESGCGPCAAAEKFHCFTISPFFTAYPR